MKRNRRIFLFAALAISLGVPSATQADPPFSGTIFIDPDIITSADPTAFTNVVAAGQGNRWMFDRRVNDWVYLNAYLFQASYNDGLGIEVQVNPEFGSTALALVEAQKYAPVIGRLPTALRQDVATVWIHKGTQPFGGGNNNLLIHVGQADAYVADGILEETFVHEAAHTSLDATHATAPGWLAAQIADLEFISTYARDNPTREDIAESYLPYLAVRFRPDRISASLSNTIAQAIPQRIAYFDSLALPMYPLVPLQPFKLTQATPNPASGKVMLKWNSLPGKNYKVQLSTNLTAWEELTNTIPSAGPETSVELDTSPGRNRQFFRVRQL